VEVGTVPSDLSRKWPDAGRRGATHVLPRGNTRLAAGQHTSCRGATHVLPRRNTRLAAVRRMASASIRAALALALPLHGVCMILSPADPPPCHRLVIVEVVRGPKPGPATR